MSLMNAIASELGGSKLSELSAALGAPEDQTKSAITAALPALISGLAASSNASEAGAQALASSLDKNHSEPLTAALGSFGGDTGAGGGLGALLGAGGGKGASSLFGAAAQLLGDGAPSKSLDGNGILGHVFGNKRSAVEKGVGQASGLEPSLVTKLLPILAPIVMSALGTLKKEQGLDASGVAGLLNNEAEEIGQGAGGGLASLLDTDNDGQIADNLVELGASLGGTELLSKLF